MLTVAIRVAQQWVLVVAIQSKTSTIATMGNLSITTSTSIVTLSSIVTYRPLQTATTTSSPNSIMEQGPTISNSSSSSSQLPTTAAILPPIKGQAPSINSTRMVEAGQGPLLSSSTQVVDHPTIPERTITINIISSSNNNSTGSSPSLYQAQLVSTMDR